MSILIVVVVLTVSISAMCSLFEAALYSTRMATLESARREGRHEGSADRFIRMKRDISVPTSSILILNTIANTSGAAVAGMLAARELGRSWVPAFTAVLTVAILLLSEILPKTVGATHWRGLWHLIAWPLAVMNTVLAPAVWFTRKFTLFFSPRQTAPSITEAEVAAMARMGASAGELTPSEVRMVEAVLELDQLTCGQIMLPRSEVIFFDADAPLADLLELAGRTRHTRYPLCRGSLDDVLGLVHVKDLLGYSADAPVDMESLARPARYVPEAQPLNRLLKEMQASRQHMAIVVDEHGAAAGVVTLENVFEQIVGSVQDEFDDEAPDVVAEGSGDHLVRGGAPLRKVRSQLGLTLRSHVAKTVSGYVVSKLGRIPRVGDTVDIGAATAEVVETRRGRATLVRLSPHRSPDDEVEDPE